MPPLSTRVAKLAGHALDFVFTPRCVGCNREGAYLCQRCLGEARPQPLPYYPDNAGGPNACLVSSIYLSGVLACFAMEGTVREAVHGLKYDGIRALAPMMSGLLVRRIQDSGLTFDALAPVPLHPKRLRQRGYNQSALLAERAARTLGLPLLPALERTTFGPPQARSHSMQERRASVRGAFKAACPVKGMRLLLVDDVCTTGATLDACAQALVMAGALTVWGVAFAREL